MSAHLVITRYSDSVWTATSDGYSQRSTESESMAVKALVEDICTRQRQNAMIVLPVIRAHQRNGFWVHGIWHLVLHARATLEPPSPPVFPAEPPIAWPAIGAMEPTPSTDDRSVRVHVENLSGAGRVLLRSVVNVLSDPDLAQLRDEVLRGQTAITVCGDCISYVPLCDAGRKEAA